MRDMRPRQEQQHDFDQAIIDLARVTRVMAGGKRMRFRACVVLGDKAGRIGMGTAKGADVQLAISKAASAARKNMISIHVAGGTIPHAVSMKFKAAKVLLKPAALGTGVIAGGAVRTVLILAGVENVVGKILGSNNKLNNVHATIRALESLRDEVPAHMQRQIDSHKKMVEGRKAERERILKEQTEREAQRAQKPGPRKPSSRSNKPRKMQESKNRKPEEQKSL
ncbi:MAG: ribosomal protein S5, nonfunctional [Parcubacteria group bacterium GW2011_GWA2_43_13]|nr:MAG: ribosomal protein S5, nonfunctional [Parcubacteria group bacterium GW2011_GWA2_43_13]